MQAPIGCRATTFKGDGAGAPGDGNPQVLASGYFSGLTTFRFYLSPLIHGSFHVHGRFIWSFHDVDLNTCTVCWREL
jgi:hypothetical protein